jgi:hypothetical protein
MIRKFKLFLVLAFSAALLMTTACEDDPIIDPTGDNSGEGGSYGSVEMPRKGK